MANQIDLQSLIRNAAAYRNAQIAPVPSLLAVQTEEQRINPNTINFQPPPFPTASANAPSGLPPGNVVPIVPAPVPVAAKAEPVAQPTPVLPPVKTDAETMADAIKGIGPDISTTTHKATEYGKAALANRVEASKNEELNLGKKTNEEIQKAAELHQQDLIDQAAAEAAAKEAQARQEAAQQRVNEESNRLDAARADYEQNGTIKSMFGSIGQRIQANLMTGIGAFAAARGSGLPNLAADNIKRDMDEWYKQEVSRVAQSKNLLDMSREDYQKALNDAEIALKNKQAAMAGVAARERASILSSHGATEAQIAGDSLRNKLLDDRNKMIEENQQKLQSTTTTSNATQQSAKLFGLQEAAKSNKLGEADAGTLQKLGEFDDYLKQTDNTLKLMKENPDLIDHVMKARRQYQKFENEKNIPFIGKAAAGVTQAIGQAPQTEEDAISGKFGPYFGANHTKELSPEDAAKAREIYRGIKNLEVAKGMTFGGVLRDSDVELAQNIASTIQGNPSELIKSVENFRNNIEHRRDIITANKKVNEPGGSQSTGTNRAALIQEAAGQMEKIRRNPQDQTARARVMQIKAQLGM